MKEKKAMGGWPQAAVWCRGRVGVSVLFSCSSVYAASTIAASAPLWKDDRPVCNLAASGAMPLDRAFLLKFYQLILVDQERSMATTAFTLENVGWHSVLSSVN